MGYGGKEREYQQRLKQVYPLPIVDNAKCFDILKKNTFLGNQPKFYLHDSFLCAGGIENIDACRGDGGGSLVCKSSDDPERWEILNSFKNEQKFFEIWYLL